MEKFTHDDIPNVAKAIIAKAKHTGLGSATLIALSGDLGAGKTTLTQEIARQLGVKENVISPTFVIMKKYEVVDDTFKYLVHIDAYRLEKDEELIKLGWKEILEDKNNLVIIEWPENVIGCIPDKVCKVRLSHQDEGTRTVEFQY